MLLRESFDVRAADFGRIIYSTGVHCIQDTVDTDCILIAYTQCIKQKYRSVIRVGEEGTVLPPTSHVNLS